MRTDQLLGYVVIAVVFFLMGEVVEWIRERRQDRRDSLESEIRRVVGEVLAERAGRPRAARKQG